MKNPFLPLSRAPLPVALLLGTGLGGACGTRTAEPQRPSVILVSIDTLRPDHLGLYGYERATSPFLDALAEESLVFERAFAPSAWTLISHMTMLTGLYPHQHGVTDWNLALADETPLVAQRLQELGYQTAALYYEGWIHERHGFDRGFDHFRSHADAEEAEAHLRELREILDPDRPFFLFLHLFDVHCGEITDERGPLYDCPPPYDELFMESAAAKLPDVSERTLWNRYAERLSETERAALVALYDGGIRYVDDKLAGWVADWRADGWLDDALLIVTSDHGEALGQHDAIRGHGGCYQEGLRVPLLLRHPDGVRAGERSLGAVHLADIVPTILEFCGLAATELGAGRSLFDTAQPDRMMYALNPANYEVVLEWPNKWVRIPRQDDKIVWVDLEQDPEELEVNEVDADEFERMRAAFFELNGGPGQHAAAVSVEIESADLKALEDIGYAGEEDEE